MIRQISVALIRQNNAILLVHQQGSSDSKSYWALPGGTVERGETLPQTLIREVHEETGLQVTGIGGLVYLVQSVKGASQSTAFVFEVIGWVGSIHVVDDPVVFDAAFVPLAEAIDRLGYIPYRNMREPITAFLRGDVSAGAAWFYRNQANGHALVDCIAATRSSKG